MLGFATGAPGLAYGHEIPLRILGRLGDDATVTWLALHPGERGSGQAKRELTLLESIALGAIEFMFVSVAGFAPWAFAGKALHDAVGELGLYAACAPVFIGLSGVVLHRLIIGPGSFRRFYALFAVAFTTYSVGWVNWLDDSARQRWQLGGTVAWHSGDGLVARPSF